MPNNEEFYDRWIDPQFRQIHDKQDEILRLLRGDNGDPGLIDDVRDNTKFRYKFVSGIKWLTATVISAVITFVVWVFGSKSGG